MFHCLGFVSLGRWLQMLTCFCCIILCSVITVTSFFAHAGGILLPSRCLALCYQAKFDHSY